MSQTRMYPLSEALKAQQALRTAGELGPEMFPLEAFVGMVSDEIQSLRERGRSDDEIAALIRANSQIEISPDEIARFYATAEERHQNRP
jgi:hypothetical protein